MSASRTEIIVKTTTRSRRPDRLYDDMNMDIDIAPKKKEEFERSAKIRHRYRGDFDGWVSTRLVQTVFYDRGAGVYCVGVLCI